MKRKSETRIYIILQPLTVFFGLKQQSVVVEFTFLEEVKSTSINLSCCLMKSETCSDFKDTRGGHWEKSFFHFHFFSNYYVSV